MAEFIPLAGKICLVTGATRGLGKGVALQLGQAGATVYITGRTLKASGGKVGSLEDTAQEIEARGGKCIPVQCDHGNMDDVEKLFERIKQEQDGQLDVLVNNAYAGVQGIMDSGTKQLKFWECDPSMWDDINNVGLRNHYYCSVYAARIMVPRKRGLIVNISSPGGLRYLFNVPYGVGKAACDRMAADGAMELRKHGVAFVSLWPGAVLTETISTHIKTTESSASEKEVKVVKQQKKMFADGESAEYAGKAVAYLARDQNIMKKSGRILITADLGDEFGFVDINGLKAANMRTMKYLVKVAGFPGVATWIPTWFRVPCWMLTLSGGKF